MDKDIEVGDIVVKKKGFSSNLHASNYAGEGYDDLPNIFRVGDMYKGIGTEPHTRDAVFDNSSDKGGIFTNFLRHAEPHETKTLKKMEAFERLKDELLQKRNNKKGSKVS